MASSHSSRSDAELQREKKAGEAAKLLQQQAVFSPFRWLPCRQDEGALHAHDVQLVLIGLLGRFANLQNINTGVFDVILRQ